MDDKEKKELAEIVASAVAASSRLKPHDRLVTARECDIKHGQIMSVLKETAGRIETVHRSQTNKMEAVHTDVRNMQSELSVTTGKINGHVSWHDGIKEEITGEHKRTSIKWTKIGAVAKWVGIGILILSTVGTLAWTAAKMTSMAATVEVINGKAPP